MSISLGLISSSQNNDDSLSFSLFIISKRPFYIYGLFLLVETYPEFSISIKGI